MGYGAMQLAGPGVFGPPKDRAAAVAVLRAAVQSGVNHIDTSDFYGPHITNQVIREAEGLGTQAEAASQRRCMRAERRAAGREAEGQGTEAAS